MKRYKLRALMTEDGLEFIRVPRRKTPKHEKLDLNVPIEAEVYRCRRAAILNKLKALK